MNDMREIVKYISIMNKRIVVQKNEISFAIVVVFVLMFVQRLRIGK